MYTDNFNVMVNGLDVLFDEIVRMAEKARNKPRPRPTIARKTRQDAAAAQRREASLMVASWTILTR